MTKPTWHNWAGNCSSNATVVQPADLNALRAAVATAARPTRERPRRQIRAAGGSYSWSPLVVTDDTVIAMGKLDRLLALDVRNQTIEVEAGMSIAALDAIARANGLTLITPTLFPLPTVGGAIAAACHGTAKHAGSFSDDVLELTIVRADGSLRTLRRPDRDGSDEHDDFRAAQCALGALGVVYSVKLKLESQFNVTVDKRKLVAADVLARFDDLIASDDYLEIFWWPFEDTLWVYSMNRTDSWPDPKTLRGELGQDLNTLFENFAGGKVLPWIARHMPGATPAISRISNWAANTVSLTTKTASDAFHFQKAYPKCFDMEYAFKIEDSARAWQTAHDLVAQYARAGLYPVNLAIHGRFSGEGKGWLAPDRARRTCYVEVVTVETTHQWKQFYAELEKSWLEIEGARPHWCKLSFAPRELKGRYEQMDAFLAVRERWDPQRVFLNDYLEHEVFQLPALRS